ncbi:hypothetical protein LT493_17905 [Streptomyces tricolor]|nr:hypothetical protein [Streptomyces tricolor]
MTPEEIDRQARKPPRTRRACASTGRASSDGQPTGGGRPGQRDVHGSLQRHGGQLPGHPAHHQEGSLRPRQAGEDFWRATFSRGMTAEQAEEEGRPLQGPLIKPPE